MNYMLRAEEMLRRAWNTVSNQKILFAIIGFGIILRLSGISYGLPLMIVSDEPPFTLAALQMIQLKTLIPSLYPEVFNAILYYPPYLAYIYLPFFLAILGAYYIFFSGDVSHLTAYLVSDLSAFFVTARVISLVFAVFSMYLVYRITTSLFQSRTAALAATFLLSTSLLHIALSMVARHWLPVSFLFLLVLFLLTHEKSTDERRYGVALLIVGFGMGVSSISVLLVIPLVLHYILFGRIRFADALRNRFLWVCGIGSLTLAALPTFLYSGSNGFLTDITLFESKSVFGFLSSPLHALSLTAWSEPSLTLFLLVGLVLLARDNWRLSLFFGGWLVSYAAVFYTIFYFDTRFFLPVVPLYAILGGYAISRLWRYHVPKIIIIALLAVPLSSALALATLAYTNDTRVLARAWMQEHVNAGEKVLVYVNLTRLPATGDAIEELREIDERALRKVDEADETLDAPYAFHALNLYTIASDSFFETLPDYAREHAYAYLITSPEYIRESPVRKQGFDKLIEESEVVASWRGSGVSTSISSSAFLDSFTRLYTLRHLGPDIVIYKLHAHP